MPLLFLSTFPNQKSAQKAAGWLIGKSNKKCFARIKKSLDQFHPYDVPELICFDIKDGYSPYMAWLTEQLK